MEVRVLVAPRWDWLLRAGYVSGTRRRAPLERAGDGPRCFHLLPLAPRMPRPMPEEYGYVHNLVHLSVLFWKPWLSAAHAHAMVQNAFGCDRTVDGQLHDCVRVADSARWMHAMHHAICMALRGCAQSHRQARSNPSQSICKLLPSRYPHLRALEKRLLSIHFEKM